MDTFISAKPPVNSEHVDWYVLTARFSGKIRRRTGIAEKEYVYIPRSCKTYEEACAYIALEVLRNPQLSVIIRDGPYDAPVAGCSPTWPFLYKKLIMVDLRDEEI